MFTQPDAYLDQQPGDLPVHFAHADWKLGRVRYLERSDRLGLIAVATIDADISELLSDGDWYWSDRIRSCGALHRAGSNRDARALARNAPTANCGTRPIAWTEGDIETGASAPWTMTLWWDDVSKRAAEATAGERYRRRPESLPIVDLELDELKQRAATVTAAAAKVVVPRQLTRGPTPERVYVRHNIGEVLSYR